MSTTSKVVGSDHFYKLHPHIESETWTRTGPHAEPVSSGAVCNCGLAASQFASRREFNEHRQVCGAIV